MADLFNDVYRGEIFLASRCLQHENNIIAFCKSQLQLLGYRSSEQHPKVWYRGDRTVVICLVDDIDTCSDRWSAGMGSKFDRNTVVITDNYVCVPTEYQVLRLPDSFFGIYHHDPSLDHWTPDRRFNFSINRLDTKRVLLYLELRSRTMRLALPAQQGITCENMDYVNFNCWHESSRSSQDTQDLRRNLANEWQNLPQNLQTTYQAAYDTALPHMPYCNHDLSHEQSHLRAWLNIVVETYSSDSNIALSEKTFRALTLPVPWIIYGGRHIIAYLRSLGFDTLDDLVSHKYDGSMELGTADYGDKMVDFIWQGTETVDQMRASDFTQMAQRCMVAAQKNRAILSSMSSQLPEDLAHWWCRAVAIIK